MRTGEMQVYNTINFYISSVFPLYESRLLRACGAPIAAGCVRNPYEFGMDIYYLEEYRTTEY